MVTVMDGKTRVRNGDLLLINGELFVFWDDNTGSPALAILTSAPEASEDNFGMEGKLGIRGALRYMYVARSRLNSEDAKVLLNFEDIRNAILPPRP